MKNSTKHNPSKKQFEKTMLSIVYYNEEDFKEAMELFEKGKAIPKEEITLHIGKDNNNEPITYNLLDKDSLLGPILSLKHELLSGEQPLQHALSERNSKYMVFKSNNTILGYSWVWYDETTKKICLDGITLHGKFQKEFLKDPQHQNEFLDCLKRMSVNFVNEMKEKGLDVSSVTIGTAFNGVKELLQEHFKKEKNASTLTGYNGYTRAKNQFVVYNNTANKK